MKKLISVVLVTTLLATNSIMVMAAPMLKDIKPTDWHYATTSKVVDKGIMKGYPDSSFKPQNNITKAEFLTTAVKIYIEGEIPSSGDFWARSYIEKARELNVITVEQGAADDSAGEWNKPITRQEMATIIAKTVALKGSPADTTGKESVFKDYASICDYCKPYVLQAYSAGIIQGYNDGTFGPIKNATRAEAGVMLARLDDPSLRVDLTKGQNIGGIVFNPSTDLRPDGMMTEAKAKEFLDKTLETIKFYSEGGKYYVTGTLPQLPDGFTNAFAINLVYKSSKPLFSITSGWTMSKEDKILSTGTFKREVTGMTSVADVDYIDVVFGIDNVAL